MPPEMMMKGKSSPLSCTIFSASGALKPGIYYFQCDVHTTMNGTFVVAK